MIRLGIGRINDVIFNSLKLLMVNKMYISNVSKLLHFPVELLPHIEKIGKVSNIISY